MSRDRPHVRWPTGRFVHLLGWTRYDATVCRRVISWHRPRAIPTDDPVTCPECLRVGERMRWR